MESKILEPYTGRVGQTLVSRTTQAWDYFFQQRKGCWIIIFLKSGDSIGGELGKGSFVSLTPHPKDVFIQKAYNIKEDGTFGEPLVDNIGMWIDGSDIQRIEFFRVEEG